MFARSIRWFIVIGAAVGIVSVLVLMGMASVIELWQTTPVESWYIPVLLTPLVGGICALVCYLLYDLFLGFSQGEKDSSLPYD